MWKPQGIGNKQWLLGSTRSVTMRLGRKCADNTRWNMLMMLTCANNTCWSVGVLNTMKYAYCLWSCWIIRASCSLWTREQVAPDTPVSLPAAPRCNFIAPFCTQVHLSVPGTLYYTQDPGTLVKSFLNLWKHYIALWFTDCTVLHWIYWAVKGMCSTLSTSFCSTQVCWRVFHWCFKMHSLQANHSVVTECSNEWLDAEEEDGSICPLLKVGALVKCLQKMLNTLCASLKSNL